MTDPRDELLVPDRRVVSIEEAKTEQAKQRSTSKMDDYVTRREFVRFAENVANGVGEASRIVGQQVHDHIADETGQMLNQMDHSIRVQMMLEFERRSWRGRWRAWLIRWGLRRPAPAAVLEDDDDPPPEKAA